jgi:serine protease DegQ
MRRPRMFSTLLATLTIGVAVGLTIAAVRDSEPSTLLATASLQSANATSVPGIPGAVSIASTSPPSAVEVDDEVTGFERIPDIVERVQPSVVSVLVRTPDGSSEGSGVVWNADLGQIIINNHVVADATSVEIVLASGERLTATVRAADALVDLAVVEVDRLDVPQATFADELPRVGELAITLGNPLGFENSVTAGIVSGPHRAIPDGGLSLIDLVQTDAPISPGNSGGALVDTNGTVIGINVAAIPPTADTRASSLGFAIPTPTVKRIVRELIADGVAQHAFVGIQPANVAPLLQEEFELTRTEGIVVVDLVEGRGPTGRPSGG